MSKEHKKKKGDFLKQRKNHLLAAKNSEELKKIRAGEIGILYIDGKYYECEDINLHEGKHRKIVVQLRPGKWIIANEINKDGYYFVAEHMKKGTFGFAAILREIEVNEITNII